MCRRDPGEHAGAPHALRGGGRARGDAGLVGHAPQACDQIVQGYKSAGGPLSIRGTITLRPAGAALEARGRLLSHEGAARSGRAGTRPERTQVHPRAPGAGRRLPRTPLDARVDGEARRRRALLPPRHVADARRPVRLQVRRALSTALASSPLLTEDLDARRVRRRCAPTTSTCATASNERGASLSSEQARWQWSTATPVQELVRMWVPTEGDEFPSGRALKKQQAARRRRARWRRSSFRRRSSTTCTRRSAGRCCSACC